MIRLTEVYWEKGMDDFDNRPISVNPDHIMSMRPIITSLSGTPQYANIVFGDKVPDRYRQTISSRKVTEILQTDGSTVEVAETLDEIDSILINESKK